MKRSALSRAQHNVHISAPIALEKRRAQLAVDALAETELQFQLPISGTAASTLSWGTATLAFDVDFFDAPEQRDSSLSVPQFTFGAFMDSPSTAPAGAVMVSACVQQWTSDARGAIVGAVVSIGVLGDGEYSGYVHLTFQGYGAISENAVTLDVGT